MAVIAEGLLEADVADRDRGVSPMMGSFLGETPKSHGGLLEFSRIGSTTAVTRCRAGSPLKLLTPRTHGRAAWAFLGTYGGGLVAGDDIRLHVRAGEGTACLLSTQASTKIYRSSDGVPCRQELTASVADGALLVSAPAPITPFAGAVFVQRQRFDLAAGASLVLVDWLTSGRRARGERWAFSSYRARTDIHIAGRHVFRDALLLDAIDGPVAAPQRMGRFECLGLAVILGESLRSAAGAILRFVADQPVGRNEALICSASPLPGGVVLRFAGTSTEIVSRWLRDRLAFTREMLGADPWRRVGH